MNLKDKRAAFHVVGFALSISTAAAAAEEPLPPLSKKIVPVKIVKTKGGYVHVPENGPKPANLADLPPAKLLSIHGRSPTDLWFLTDDAVLLHDDGQKIVERFTQPCGWGTYAAESNGVGTKLYQVVVDKDNVHVIGEFRDMNTRVGSEVHATLGKDKQWDCTRNRSVVPMLTVSAGDITWRVGHNMDDDVCRVRSSKDFCTSGPRWAPSFEEPSTDTIDMGIHSVMLWMHGMDDGWIVTLDNAHRHALHRWNGVTWAPFLLLDGKSGFNDIWGDELGNTWFLIHEDGAWNSPANAVRRLVGQTLKPLPVPASFSASMVRGTGPRDVWFAGDANKIYQWDGDRLREGSLPFTPSEMWASIGGEVWFSSAEGGVAHTGGLVEAPR